MRTITGKDAIEALRTLVAEVGPDFVYGDADENGECVYVHNGRASCAVGRVLHEQFGVPLKELHNQEGRAPTELDFRRVALDMDAMLIFDIFQNDQDQLFPYGLALEGAERAYSRLAA